MLYILPHILYNNRTEQIELTKCFLGCPSGVCPWVLNLNSEFDAYLGSSGISYTG